jgi:hypothetical protein
MLNKRMAILPAVLLVMTALVLAPMAYASPITPSLTWGSLSVPTAGTNTATANVMIDSDCPSGQTYQGTITVVEPDGVSIGTFSVGPTPCGTPVTAVYPTDFSGTAATTQTGTYTATWAGSTSLSTGGLHPEFSLGNGFVVVTFPPVNVPEFPAPAMFMAAFGLVAIVAIRKTKTNLSS